MKDFISKHIQGVSASLTAILVVFFIAILIMVVPRAAESKSSPNDRFVVVSSQIMYGGAGTNSGITVYVVRDKETSKEYVMNNNFFTPLGTFNHTGE